MPQAAAPAFKSHFPELMDFIKQLVERYQQGEFPTEESLAAPIKAAITPQVIESIDAKAPGWAEMCSYAGGATLVHVMTVFVAALSGPEYLLLSPQQKNLLMWIILFHDIAKKVEEGKRDPAHPFFSAARAGLALPRLGFAPTAAYPSQFQAWYDLVMGATRQVDGETIPDNSRLPHILSGIERLFGGGTPAALVLKSVLLHQSLNLLDDWPQKAPLNDGEVVTYLDKLLFPYLALIHLVDSDAWNLFEPELRQPFRRQVYNNLSRIWHLIE
jgi:hypothetical protein